MDKKHLSLIIAIILLSVLIIYIGYNVLAPSLYNEKIYPVENMFLRNSSLIWDETIADPVIYAGNASKGFVSYGPYVYLPPGDYSAFYYIKATPGQEGLVCTIDAYSLARNPATPLISRSIEASDFGDDGFKVFVLNFTSRGENDFEFRTTKNGLGEIWTSDITIRPDRNADILHYLMAGQNIGLLFLLLAGSGLALALIAAYYRQRQWLEHLPGKLPISLYIFVALAFCYSAIIIMAHSSIMPDIIMTGDEPHYLMMTQSMIQDKDYNLQNNLENKTYFSFFPYDLGSGQGQYVLDKNGNLLSVHGPGLAVILIAPYILGGVVGARLFLALIASLSISLLYVLLERSGISRRISLITVMLAAVCSPLIFYSFSIYTETIALAIVLGTAILFADTLRGKDNASYKFFLAGAVLSFLPWLGVKYSAIALSSLLIAGYFFAKKRIGVRKILYISAPVIVSMGLFGLFLLYHFGSFNPGMIYTGVQDLQGIDLANSDQSELVSATGPTFSLDLGQMSMSVLYRFFDQYQGLIFYAPAYTFFIIAIFILIRHRQNHDFRLISLLSALTVPYLFMYLTTSALGGYCPPSRTLIPMLPIIVFLNAIGLEYLLRKKQMLLLIPTISVSLVIPVFMIMNPMIIYNHNLLEFISPFGLDLSSLFPDQSEKAIITILLWSLVIVLLMAINEFALSLTEKKLCK